MVNYDALNSDEFANAKAAPVTRSTRILTLDYAKLKAETGIEKIKLKVSGADDEPYRFSFLPFLITKNHPRYDKLKGVFMGSDPIDWRLNLVFHRISTPTGSYKVLCPTKNYGEPCPFCERKQELFAEHEGNFKAMDKATQEEVKSLNDTERDFFLVLNHDDDKVYVMEYSTFFFGDRLTKKMARSHRGESNIILAHPGPNGHDLEFFIEPAQVKDNRGNPVIGPIEEMEFVRRKDAIDEELLKTLPPLDKYIKRYSYDEMEGMLDGTFFVSGRHNNEDKEDSEPAPAQSGVNFEEKKDDESSSRSRRRRSRGVDSDNASATTTEKDMDEEPRAVIGRKPQESDHDDDSREARRRRRQRRSKESTPECPAGGTFGKDIDNFDECEDCPIYDDCERKYEENEKQDDEDLTII